MSGRERPDLLERLKRSLGLGADDASAEILRRLHATAARLKLLPRPAVPATEPAPPPIVLRGVVVTEPRYYERLRRRSRLPLMALAARVFVWCFSICSALATLFVFVLMLLFLRYLTQTPAENNDELTLVAGMGGDSTGVQVSNEKGKDKETVESKSDKGNDKRDDPDKEPATPGIAEKPAATASEKPTETSDKPAAPDEKKSVVAEAPVLTDSAILDIIQQSQDSIGAGGGAPAPAPTAKDLGRAIREDPTKAIQHARNQTIAGLRKGKERQIVVVGGEYDECERILDALKVPHVLVSPEHFLAYDLDGAAAVIVNCDGRYSRSRTPTDDDAWKILEQLRDARQKIVASLEKIDASDATGRKELQKRLETTDADIDRIRGRLESRTAGPTAKKVREFVKAGGYLMTTDWALTVTESAFPGFIYFASRYGPQRVTILAENKNKDHPLLKEALLDDANGTRATGGKTISWFMDSGSYLFDYDDDKVTLLVRGPGLPNYHALVCTFRPFAGGKGKEGGRVVHVAGHFKSQGDAYGDYVLESLFLNFLSERIEKGD